MDVVGKEELITPKEEVPELDESAVCENHIEEINTLKQENEENGISNDILIANDINNLLIESDGGEVDLPNDFFDDFNNVDFLAGLDVVDAWEDEDQADVGQQAAAPNHHQPESTSNDAPIVESERVQCKGKQILKDESVESKAALKQEKNGTDCKQEEEQLETTNSKYALETKNARSKSHERTKNRDELRRDPQKVKRDIQRSKEKCEKERIVAKLQMVETGLVPPGTEMDMPDTTEESKLLRAKKRAQSRSVSPVRRRRSRSRSPPYHVRRPSPPPIVHRRRSRSKTPIAARYYSSASWRKRHRSRSRSRSRDRSNSYRRKRSTSRDGPQRKQSFLEEISEKLGAQSRRSTLLSTPQPVPAPPPPLMHSMHPVYPTPGVPVMSYDQQYYVQQDVNPYATGMYSMSMPCATFDPYQQHDSMYTQSQAFAQSQPEQSIDKLFNDANISLTEFLRITRRPTDSSLQLESAVKDKVIGRSQDAQTILNELSQPSGIFYCIVNLHARRKKIVAEKKVKQTTPMRSGAMVSFRYTSNVAARERTQTPLLRLLAKMGIDELAMMQKQHNQQSGAPPIEIRDTEDCATQTEHPLCDVCATQKEKRFVDVGIQCQPETESFGTQFNDEKALTTARSALQNVLRNQSLSSYTPAQILGMKQQETRSSQPSQFERRAAPDRRDMFANLDGGYEPRGRGLLPKPPHMQPRHQFLNPPGFNSYRGPHASGSNYHY